MTDSKYVTDWSGVYIGGRLGGAFSNLSWGQDNNNFNSGTGVAAPANTPVEFSPSGVFGGIIGGANLQIGQWIFGAELTFSGTDLSQSAVSPFFPATDTYSTNLDWLGTVEGRVGYSWDRVMVFGKGGWAGSNATLKVTSPVRGTASKSEFVDGWTIGGGIEYAFLGNFSAKLEYLYVDLGSFNAAMVPAVNNVSFKENIIRAGLNYKFSGPIYSRF
jgi:outer membrane immunogenic protein